MKILLAIAILALSACAALTDAHCHCHRFRAEKFRCLPRTLAPPEARHEHHVHRPCKPKTLTGGKIYGKHNYCQR